MFQSLWSEALSLGIPEIDASHKTLLDKIGQLAAIPDAEFPIHYAAMVARVESDFREEDELMEELPFASSHSHREQHARLLGELHRAAAAVMAGDVALGRQAVSMLPHWFIRHIETMDAALAFSLQFRREIIPHD